MRKNNSSVILFLAGLFAMTEVYIGGFIAISELIFCVFAPFIFLKDIKSLKHDGFMPIIVMFVLTMIGCCVASNVNDIPSSYFRKGIAAIYTTLAVLVCMHRLLREDFSSVKWFFVGYAFSLVLNIFIFQRGSARHGDDISLISDVAFESTVNSVLFWSSRLPHWLYVPVRGWYLGVPNLYSLMASVAIAAISLLSSSGSGRSAALCAIVTFGMLVFGRKSRESMLKLKKYIYVMFFSLLVLGLLSKFAYQRLALSGALGDAAARKYEQQTKSGTGIVNLLIAGRGQFFAGLYCAIKNPIIGYGPWAIDKDGVAGEFLAKYGTQEDYDIYLRYQMNEYLVARKNLVVPAHSCIIGWWIWYGIFGLLTWLYILWLYWRTVTRYFVAYVPWFGCMVTILPTAVWDAFFSPYGNRVMMALFFAMCLYLKAVYEKRFPAGGIRYGRDFR